METNENTTEKTEGLRPQKKDSQFPELIKHITFELRKHHLDYEQTKYVFKEVRKRLNLKCVKPKRGVKEHLSQEQMRKIIEKAYHKPGTIGLMLKILLFTGCRITEFVNIKREHLYIEENKILITHGKGNKQRYVPMFSFYKGELMTYLSTTKGIYLFETRLHDKYSTRRVQQILKGLAEEAGITQRVHPHMLRRTIATWLRDKDIPIEQIKDFLGHEHIQTTLIYAKGSIEKLTKDMNKALLTDGREL